MAITYQVEVCDNSTEWRLDGEKHREDGPAVEWANGYKAWYLNGKKHREDGPAVVDANGDEYWYLKGIQINKEDVMEISCGKIVEIDGIKYKLEKI